MARRKEAPIKVVVTYSDGYQQRFTSACLEQLRRRRERQMAGTAEAGPEEEKGGRNADAELRRPG